MICSLLFCHAHIDEVATISSTANQLDSKQCVMTMYVIDRIFSMFYLEAPERVME
jgi:uncharacterized protein (DUF486 family)